MKTSSAKRLLALTFLASAIAVLIVSVLTRQSVTFICAAAGPLLILFIISIARTYQTRGQLRFWNSIVVGLVFLCGGAYGVAHLLEQRERWPDILPLVIPIGLGLYILRFALSQRPVTLRRDTA